MDQSLWRSTFKLEKMPAYPCPECGHGKLALRKSSYQTREGEHSKRWKYENQTEDEFEGERFIGFLVCNEEECGEIVAISGCVVTEQIEGPNGSARLVSAVEPMSMYPAPHIIHVSPRLNREMRRSLIKSFGLYWADKSSCANAIRITVERLLDSFKIAKTTVNQKGKRVPLALASRIDKFEAKITGHKAALNALRSIGNVGSHDSETTEEEVLTAYMVLEKVLSELIDKESVQFDKLTKSIVKSKGKIK